MNPCIAIIEPNTLNCMSLRNMLWEIYNKVEVLCYGSMDEFIRDSNRHFVHFFVESDTLFCHFDEFETLKSQTTVISKGRGRQFEEAGFNVLDITLSEEALSSKLLHLQFMSHYSASLPDKRKYAKGKLSEREKEVLAYMVKGMLNKEIAEILDISLNTVIFHRNNICEKLQTRSIGRLTIFAVLSGIVDINDI